MKCQTTSSGAECYSQAAFVIAGPLIKRHLTCVHCLRAWRVNYNEQIEEVIPVLWPSYSERVVDYLDGEAL